MSRHQFQILMSLGIVHSTDNGTQFNSNEPHNVTVDDKLDGSK
jgi:hypothetical protein